MRTWKTHSLRLRSCNLCRAGYLQRGRDEDDDSITLSNIDELVSDHEDATYEGEKEDTPAVNQVEFKDTILNA